MPIRPVTAGGASGRAGEPATPSTRCADDPAPPLPGGRPFVGREREMADLEAALARARAGARQIVLLGGEPGAGKTRTASELGRRADAAGFRVLWGRCDESPGAPAYWPWVQIVRSWVAGADAATVAADLGRGAADVARVVPAVAERVGPAVASAAPEDPEHARFCFFDGVATLLANAARRRPLLLVVDDLQAADRASLVLLRFLAGHQTAAPLMVLATYRTTEAASDPRLREALDDAAREPGTHRIELRGISADAVRQYVALTTGAAPAADVVDAIVAATHGNPFFVGEMVHRLVDAGFGAAAEPGTDWRALLADRGGTVAGDRLGALSPEHQRVLALAAVLGREFDVPVLHALSGLSLDAVLAALAEPLRSGVLTRDAEAPGHFRFRHALLRESLYAGLSIAERARLHLRVCEVVEAVCAGDLEPRLAELAHHAAEAVPVAGPARAVAYAVRAAAAADRALAWEDAVRHYERALELLEAGATAAPGEVADLWLGLGAALTNAGERDRARDAFARAAEVARAAGDRVRFARAALGRSGPWIEFGRVDPRGIALLEEAVASAPPDDALRARLASRLALELYHVPDRRDERDALAGAALDLARRLGDAATLAEVVSAHRYVTWRPENPEERLALATEIVRLGEAAGRRDLVLRARAWRAADLLELGDANAVWDEMEVCRRLAEDLRQPHYLHLVAVLRASLTALGGRVDEAERLAFAAYDLGRRVQPATAMQAFTVQLMAVRGMQGRMAEVADACRACVEAYPAVRHWRWALALVLTDVGRNAEARPLFEEFAADDFASLARDFLWLIAAVTLAHVCWRLGDVRRAAVLYDRILPYADRNCIVADGFMAYGCASQALGLLATLLGRWDDVDRHFERAIEFDARLGARFSEAEDLRWYVHALVHRGAPGDGERALARLAALREIAEPLGLRGPLRDADALERRARALAVRDARARDARARHARWVFEADGGAWVVGDPDALVRLRDTPGMRHLAHLVRMPGRAVPAGELARAAGPGGACAPDAPARVRVRVTKAIQRAIVRVRRAHPALGVHLAARVKTGNRCAYVPDPDVRWVPAAALRDPASTPA